jgi:pyruvate dehydrogenase E1 component
VWLFANRLCKDLPCWRRLLFAMDTVIANDREDIVAALELLETRLRWLSSWTIHNANHLRPKRDGLKVGGHQASCAS